jgi:hypothetical protein
MATKLVGMEGRALIAPAVTGKDERTLPKSRPAITQADRILVQETMGRKDKARQTQKLKAAQHVLAYSMVLDFNKTAFEVLPYTPNELYKLLRQFGYHWTGETWQREYPDWVKVDKHGETEK